MFTLDLDMVVVVPAEAAAEARWWLDGHDIPDMQVEVLAESGPGGGWPLVRFTSDNKAAMEAVAKAYWEQEPDMVAAAIANLEVQAG
jgi:3-oxoacyl-(acyl-carrier-protein) synthase